jgi:hypothetical protein
MPQVTYSLTPTVGTPGQLADNQEGVEIVSYPAAEFIPFGRAVVLDSSGKKVQLPQAAGSTLGTMKGVAIYQAAREQALFASAVGTGGGSGGYAIGDMVPICRRGCIYVAWTGTTQTDGATPNIRHASTDANSEAQHRGKFTDASTSTTVASEIAAAPGGLVLGRDTGSTAFALVDVNFP